MTGAGAGALLAVLVTLVTTPVVIAGLRHRHLLDQPNERSSHHVPTPRGGGIATGIGCLVALVASSSLSGATKTGLMVAAIGFGLIGATEDLRGVPPAARFGLQVTAAGLCLPFLLDGLGGPWAWQALFVIGCLLWLVAYSNAFNFMDGINGISAAQVVVAGGAWWAMAAAQDVPELATGAGIVMGAALAFAPFNYPRATVFLGDVGSYLFGAWLAVLVIVALRAGLAPEAVIAPVALYLADTGSTLLRRFRAGDAWYLPHRGHAYQRLTALGWSHTRTTAVVALIMMACSGLGAVTLTGPVPARAAADAALVALLAAYLASPAVLARLRRREQPNPEARRAPRAGQP